MEKRFLLVAQDANVHGSGMKIDSALVLVLFGVYPPLEGRISLGFLLGLEMVGLVIPILLRLGRRPY